MIPAFVISLSGAADRRERITKTFDEIGLDFEFFDAVDGRQFNVLEQSIYDAPKRLRCFGKHLTGGEIGCSLSHKKAYAYLVENKIERALIFEDDVILRPDFINVLKEVLSCDVPYDMVRFLGSPKLERLKMRAVHDLDGTHHLTRHTGMPGGTHATLVTLAGAKKALRHLDKTAFPIDAFLGRSWETGLNWYTVRPGLAAQDLSFESLIGNDVRFDEKQDIQGLHKALFPLTRAWFKLTETIGKKYWYYSKYFEDRKYG